MVVSRWSQNSPTLVPPESGWIWGWPTSGVGSHVQNHLQGALGLRDPQVLEIRGPSCGRVAGGPVAAVRVVRGVAERGEPGTVGRAGRVAVRGEVVEDGLDVDGLPEHDVDHDAEAVELVFGPTWWRLRSCPRCP